MDIHFNTGRLYTSQGQIMRAMWEQDSEVIHFADFSRACHGTIPCPTYAAEFTRPGSLARFVMEHYDRGGYVSTKRSWELLMMTGRDETATVHQFQL